MPLIEECPFFNMNFNNLEEPYASSGYGTSLEGAAETLQQCLAPGHGGYNGGTIGQHLQDCMDIAAVAKNSLSAYGSSSGCTINTNFDSVKKAQYYSFIAFLRNKFERYRQICNYQIENRYNQPCKKIELRFEFSFINNTFNFTVNQVSDAVLIDSEKIEEEFNVSSFSGQIYYNFYVKPEVVCELSSELEEKIDFLVSKTHEILDKTEE